MCSFPSQSLSLSRGTLISRVEGAWPQEAELPGFNPSSSSLTLSFLWARITSQSVFQFLYL